jgi:hypothetical protein
VSVHITDDEIRRFGEGRLERLRVEEVGRHARECERCAARVWQSREIGAAVKSVAGHATRSPARTLVWLAAAAALAIVIAGVVFFATTRTEVHPLPVRSVRLPQPPSHPWDAVAADALQRGRVDPPAWLHDLRRSGEALRGTPHTAGPVRLIVPLGVAVESQTPRFSWTGIAGATYEVRIARNREAIETSGRIAEPEWQNAKPLARDSTYEWQLIVIANGKRSVVPSVDQPPALFHVIAANDAQLLAGARASGDALAAGIIAARAGVVDEAVRELSRSTDPRVRAIAADVSRW